jgi:hypothetical protein
MRESQFNFYESTPYPEEVALLFVEIVRSARLKNLTLSKSLSEVDSSRLLCTDRCLAIANRNAAQIAAWTLVYACLQALTISLVSAVENDHACKRGREFAGSVGCVSIIANDGSKDNAGSFCAN